MSLGYCLNLLLYVHIDGYLCEHSDITFRCASFDGDADRLVYFHVTSLSKTSVDLVDGDKILSLFVLFIREQLDIINGKDNKGLLPTRFGVVQTAYANGASTAFLKNLGLEVVFTSTGVKYLHKKALEYDIGVYFEANGHGTVLFNDEFVSRLESLTARLSEAAGELFMACAKAYRFFSF